MNDTTQPEAVAMPEAETLTFAVEPADTGTRLDAYIAARLSHVSRTRLKQWIEDGEVLIDGRAAEKGSYKLRDGETIELEPPAPPISHLVPEDIPLDIVFEDEAVVVVNKPAGMVVHPAAGVPQGTLANALAYRLRTPQLRMADDHIADCGLRIADSRADETRQYIPPVAGELPASDQAAIRNPQSAIEASAIRNSQSSVRPGIVHRLDRDTSGLVVVAKTEQAHEHLMDQFRERKVFKSYVALVHGVVREDKGHIEEPIGRDPRHRTRMAVVRGGRHALSIFRVRQRFTRFTLLDVEIKTGRTHQIRVHLTWLKHPVVGDEVYGTGRDQTVPDPTVRAAVAALGRQFLHAARLGFFHPRTGEWMKFEAPLPDDLARLLSALEPAG
ncbi:MAG: RluA family pseudouridine synthase [Pyrinomonadaceae bacterium]